MIMWYGVGNGDAFDLYWYNNHIAEGNQTYPSGIHKYYDVFSWEGYKQYFYDFCLAWIFSYWTVVTILPLDVWVAIIRDNVEKDYIRLVDLYVIYHYFALVREYLFPILNWQLERGFYVG